MATPTGIEPVFSGVTGQRLNHSTKEPYNVSLAGRNIRIPSLLAELLYRIMAKA